jgi:esterase/lipase
MNEKSSVNLFEDRKIDYSHDLELPFVDYIAQSSDIITKNRADLNQYNKNTILKANAPFEYRPENPNHQGILMIHGLFDSPFIFRELGKKLAAQGFLVRAILLPGHGTGPGALLNVKYQQWLKTVEYGIHSFKKEVDKVFIVGFSLGGTLALLQKDIAGLILLSPAIKIRSYIDFAANWYRSIAWVIKSAAWFHRDKEEMSDYTKYRSITFNSIYQVYLLTRLVRKVTPTVPCLFALSQDDATVCSKSSIKYFKEKTNKDSRMILYTPNPYIPKDTRITCRSTIYADLDIFDFSHTCLPISPDNPHYGKHGDYAYTSFIPPKEKIIYGEYSALQLKINQIALHYHLTDTKLQRLSFNPDFEFLAKNISQFLTRR